MSVRRSPRVCWAPYILSDRTLQVITLDRGLEDLLSKNVKHTEHGSYLAVDPQMVDQVVQAVSREVEKLIALDIQPIVMCSPALRRHFRKMIEHALPSVFVVSHAEIVDDVNLQAAGKVKI